MKPKQKLFIIRKYIMANDAQQAIRMEKKHPVHDVWIDDEWAKGCKNTLQDAIGFTK